MHKRLKMILILNKKMNVQSISGLIKHFNHSLEMAMKCKNITEIKANKR